MFLLSITAANHSPLYSSRKIAEISAITVKIQSQVPEFQVNGKNRKIAE